jgi:hypothetical protein
MISPPALLAQRSRCGFTVLCLFLAAVLPPSAVWGAASLVFRTPPSCPVGDSPAQIVSADFNGDGITDIATANFDDSTVSVVLGTAAGYAPFTSIALPAGAHPDALALGDVNGDGRTDLITANANGWNQPGALSVLLGNGGGSFVLRTNVPVDRGPRGVVIADFNGDGLADLATAISGGWFETNLVNVVFGNGDGTFGSPARFTVGTAPAWIATADFNGDGRPDLVVVNAGPGPSGTTASVLLNTIEGPFASAMTFTVGTYPGFVATADFNHDNHPDFVVANRAAASVSLLLGIGDGTFHPATHFGVETGPSQLAVGDFNGDGHADVAAVGDGVKVLIGSGSGGFAAPVSYSIGAGLQAIGAGNFLGDTNLDLAVAGGYENNLLLMQGRGDGTFKGGSDTYATGGDIRGMATGDFNKDGRLDIVTASQGSNVVTVLVQQTNGIFLPGTIYPCGAQPHGVKSGDFNNDGWPDLVVANFGGTLTMLRGRTTAPGVFTNRWSSSFLGTVNLPGAHTDVATGFFNSGTHLDIATPNYYDATVTIALGDGTGQFHSPRPPVVPVNGGPVSVVVDDFNGDGLADLAVGHDGGTRISIATGRGDGTFDAKVDIETWEIPWFIRSADVNFDGRPDLVAAHGDWRLISVMLNTGSNGLIQFAPPMTHPVAIEPLSVAVGDFNGDNLPDIASGNFASTSVLLGHGDGTFSTAADYFVGGQQIAAGDFNNDSMPDLAIDLGGKVGLFWNDTLPALQIKRVAGGVRLAWPAWTPYTLEVSGGAGDAGGWSMVTNTPARIASQFVLTNAAPGPLKTYRLKRPAP